MLTVKLEMKKLSQLVKVKLRYISSVLFARTRCWKVRLRPAHLNSGNRWITWHASLEPKKKQRKFVFTSDWDTSENCGFAVTWDVSLRARAGAAKIKDCYRSAAKIKKLELSRR